eukprot:SAG31_NODE_521_length_14624_cov_34.536867_8_plen_93_part_00
MRKGYRVQLYAAACRVLQFGATTWARAGGECAGTSVAVIGASAFLRRQRRHAVRLRRGTSAEGGSPGHIIRYQVDLNLGTARARAPVPKFSY